MSLQQQIEVDSLVAMKSGDKESLSILRMLKSSLQNRKIEKMIPKDEFLTDDEVMSMIKSEIKKRKDSAAAYTEGKRTDLADKELAEAQYLAKYLPEQLSDDQMRELAKAAIAQVEAKTPADFGKVMGAAIKAALGRADSSVISAIIKEELNKL
jgi:uncharacterized protein YqeY